MRKVKFTIQSELDNVPLIGMAVNKICAATEFSELDAHQIELCVVEACTNVIKHAYLNESGHEIDIEVKIYLDKISFEISDMGLTMTSKTIPVVDFDPGNIEQLPTGKLGLFIINKIMNQINYTNTNGNNILTLIKFFN